MRTTLDLPLDTLEKARRAANLRTKRETVIAGLEELIRKSKREELRGLAGRVPLDVDLARSRHRRRRSSLSVVDCSAWTSFLRGDAAAIRRIARVLPLEVEIF